MEEFNTNELQTEKKGRAKADLTAKIEATERELARAKSDLARAKSESAKAAKTARAFANEHKHCGTRATQRQCALNSTHLPYTLLPSWCKVSNVFESCPSDDTDWVSMLRAWMDSQHNNWEGPLVSLDLFF